MQCEKISPVSLQGDVAFSGLASFNGRDNAVCRAGSAAMDGAKRAVLAVVLTIGRRRAALISGLSSSPNPHLRRRGEATNGDSRKREERRSRVAV